MRAALLLLATASVWAAELSLLPEHVRVDPFGEVIEADRGGAVAGSALKLESARAAYVSCRVLVQLPEGGGYRVTVSSPLESELYREWFHKEASGKRYFPDALIPVAAGGRGQMPDADVRRTYQALRLADGTTAISISEPGEVLFVDKAGKVVRTIGNGADLTRGIKFGWASGFHIQPDGGVFISDYTGRRIVEVNAKGELVNELRTPDWAVASVWAP